MNSSSSSLTRRDVLRSGASVAALSLLPKLHAAPASRPNIVWIMADQFRKQAQAYMHQDNVTTPHLDKLATEGASFTNAISAVPICTPNRSVQFSGRYAMHTNVICNGVSLMPEFKTLGDYCNEAGYQTAYFGKWHISAHKLSDTDAGYVPPELRHGFQTWYATEGIIPFQQNYFIGDDKQRTVVTSEWAPDALAVTAADYMAKRDKSKPFTMVVSFGPPHNGTGRKYEDRYMPRQYDEYVAWKKDPSSKRPPGSNGYAAPDADEALYVKGAKNYHRPLRPNSIDNDITERSKCIQGYFGAVTGIDRAVGEILESIESQGLADNTIVLFTSDHGEMMTSHGLFAKDQPYQESCGIPLLIRYPGHVKTASHDMPVNSVDFLPTLLELAGIKTLKPDVETDGQNLAPLLTGHTQPTREHAFGAFYQGAPTEGPRHWRSVYTKELTYIVCSDIDVTLFTPECLFDRTSDPYEMKQIHRGMGRDKEMDALQAILRAELTRVGDPYFPDVWDRLRKGQPADYSFYKRTINKALFPDEIAHLKGIVTNPD